MNLKALIDQIKRHPNYHRAGMILCHKGIVRSTSRDGKEVSGLTVTVDHERLRQVIETNKERPGIVEILVEISENRHLAVGDEVMHLVVAGDIRDHVIPVLSDTLDAIKSTVTGKTEFFL
jgi:molybdopterin synthase catalytic subunit